MGREDATIATGTRRRPGRLRAWTHRLTGAIGWIALVGLAIWRLPDSPPWDLPLPVGLFVLAAAAALVVCARTVDRRRRPRPATSAPASRPLRERVPDHVA